MFTQQLQASLSLAKGQTPQSASTIPLLSPSPSPPPPSPSPSFLGHGGLEQLAWPPSPQMRGPLFSSQVASPVPVRVLGTKAQPATAGQADCPGLLPWREQHSFLSGVAACPGLGFTFPACHVSADLGTMASSSGSNQWCEGKPQPVVMPFPAAATSPQLGGHDCPPTRPLTPST